MKPVRVVYGPGTFINSSVEEITKQLQAQTRARAAQADRANEAARKLALSQGRSEAQAKKLGRQAEQLVYAEFARELIALNAKYGLNLSGAPKLNDPDFVYQLVFDPARGAREPKARFAYLFPSADSALVSVRLKAGLSDDERARAVALVRAAVRMPEWRLDSGGRYVVTGVPVLAGDLTEELAGSTLRLLLVAVAVMALVLALLFRARLRLLPLGLALGAVSIVFGGLALLGLPLTMASIAVLPVLLGLAVDYAIQYQARGAPAVPAIATAALASGAGFLVLLLSPVPMVRGFGALLVIGVGVALVLALTAGTAVLTLAARRRAAGGVLARSLRGAGELVDAARDRILRAPSFRGASFLRLAARHPTRVLVVAAAFAACGWALDSRISVVSDLPRLVPQDLSAVRDLEALQRATGVAGEVDVVVEGRDLTDPRVIAWMRAYQDEVLTRHGYSAEKGCSGAALCPALSLPDLFRTPELSATREQIRALLDAVPPYFSQAAITPDRRTAVLAFGIRLQSLEGQREVMQDMRSRLDRPPAGVRVTLAGLPVLAADANHALSDPLRRLLTALAGLGGGGARPVRGLPLVDTRVGPARPDRAGHGLVGARAVARGHSAEPDVGRAQRARDRDLDRVRRDPVRSLPRGARGRLRAGRGARADLPLDRCRRAGLRRHRDRGLRGPDHLGHRDAARLRPGHGRRPRRLAARRARRPPGRAGRRGAARVASSGEARRRGVRRPGVLLAVFLVALAGWVTYNAATTEGPGSAGLGAGAMPPPFAMPLSTSSCRGACDANVATEPDQGTAGARPACDVRGRDILNSCELAEGGPFVLAFVFHPVARCRAQIGVLERVAARHAGIPFRIVAVRADAAAARELHSTLPVGFDHDGAVANLYAVVVCPTITFVGRDGRVAGSTVGAQDEAAIEEWVRRIER